MDTFTCKCGEYEYPLIVTEDVYENESVWCECGLRIQEQREEWVNA
jgi:hypothetical protein